MALSNLSGLKWVGQLSEQDADILAHFSKSSNSIIEFGSGGSTMIFAQTCKNVVSVDTSLKWITATKKRLEVLGCQDNVKFLEVSEYYDTLSNYTADLIFIDGKHNFRERVARQMWKSLSVGGYMLFHDTHARGFIASTLEIITAKFKEIEFIEINKIADDGVPSTLTILKKREKLTFPVWTREDWTYGSDMENITRLWEVKSE